ncbi:MAG TPA: Ig-like domain-containing protein, partial [Anaerolineae bacterium]|nr:Ig-like domain-containing protein [Anaerolineae bacterium]
MTLNMNYGSGQGQLRALRAAALAGVAALLVACGGDSDCTSPPAFEGEQVGECDGDDPSAAPRAADLALALSAATLSNDGSSTIVATATAVDANRNTLAEIPVTISPTNNATATPSGTATDEKGVVSAEIGIGSDRSNRSITVTATSGGLSRTATFQVIGANLTATPLPAVVAPGSTGNKVDFRLVDVNSNPMSGQTIVVNGVSGVDVTGTTDNNGSYSYSYTAPATGGSLDIRATAGGVSKTQTVLVQSGTGKIEP